MSLWLEAMTGALHKGEYAWIRETLLPMAPRPIPQCMYREIAFAERCCREGETDRVFPVRFLWLLDGHEQRTFGISPSGIGVYHPEKLLDFWSHVLVDMDVRKQHEAGGIRFNLEEKAFDLGRGWIYIGDRFVEDLLEVESCLGGEVLFMCPETGDFLPAFRAKRLLRNERIAQDVKAGQITRKYSLGFLVKHPASKSVVLKHLAPLGFDADRLGHIEGTLRVMFERNMGGGIPFAVIEALMCELDGLPNAAFEGISGKESTP